MSSRLKRALLRPYQERFIALIKKKHKVFLALDMGAGKTIITLTAIRELLDEGMVTRVLIVAPKYVAATTWPDEIDQWSHTCVLRVAVCVGTEEERIAALKMNTEIVIINRENLRWLFDIYGRSKWPFDGLVYDEASRLKGGNIRTTGKRADGSKVAKRFSEFGSLAAVRKHFDVIVELSGTPAPNGLQNLWGPLYILDGGRRLGTSITSFLKRWFITEKYSNKVEPRVYAERQITSAVEDIMFSLDPSEYPQLPPFIPNEIYINLPKKMLTDYRKFERSLVSETYDVEAVNRGVLTGKLLQFANGGMYREEPDVWPKKKEVVHVHDLKLEALDSVIEEASGAPVLVAYSFQFDLARLKKRYGKRAVVFKEEPNFVKKWNRGEIEIGLVHPGSAGHGLNLQFGGNIAVWYGLNWSLELYEQFNKRLHRPGQTKPVFCHHILARGTADESVLEALGGKKTNQQRIIDAVVERIRS